MEQYENPLGTDGFAFVEFVVQELFDSIKLDQIRRGVLE